MSQLFRPNYDLRVIDHLEDIYVSPKQVDFTLLGLIKASPLYTAGRKVSTRYLDQHEYVAGNIVPVVTKEFTDIRDVNGYLKGITITFKWHNHDDSIGEQKSDTKLFTLVEASEFEKKRRERSINHMLAESNQTALAPVIKAMYDYYVGTGLISDYIELGYSQNLIDQVIIDKDDTQHPLYSYLNIEITTSEGQTAYVWQLFASEIYNETQY